MFTEKSIILRVEALQLLLTLTFLLPQHQHSIGLQREFKYSFTQSIFHMEYMSRVRYLIFGAIDQSVRMCSPGEITCISPHYWRNRAMPLLVLGRFGLGSSTPFTNNQATPTTLDSCQEHISNERIHRQERHVENQLCCIRDLSTISGSSFPQTQPTTPGCWRLSTCLEANTLISCSKTYQLCSYLVVRNVMLDQYPTYEPRLMFEAKEKHNTTYPLSFAQYRDP